MPATTSFPTSNALLPALSTARGLGLVLYGGTAIALQLGHRASTDFDFFSERALDEAALTSAMPFHVCARGQPGTGW